ncbi:sodium-hydrogen antiporter [Plectosphaerella cucumerina]|uniref:Sodium-hydrogen antiporter n=1 Tax=Plectosphaerella cucumerina TaxID=40658 RepID=A0A8K0TH67_9PEZI|nr:sodium-hydrogen antiporter [Plectosphaerella cucumerina]
MAQDVDAAVNAGYLAYHEPTIIQLLVIISFFFFLALAEWISDKIFKAGLIGQMLVGLVYGIPLGNIMPIEWQETFISLGYIGLILIIFEGGLTVHLGLLKANFFLSTCAAAVGILVPIGLCYALLYIGWGYGAVETFIVGAALSVTSLGTTFVVIGSAAKGIDFAKTKVGTVLISAAVVSDVTGLIMASVIHNLGAVAEDSDANLGWLIGRPIVASIAMGIFSPLTAKYLAGPVFRWYLEDRFARFKHVSNILLMVFVLCAFLSIAGFAGASVLYGAFLAGTFLSALPCIHPDAPFMVFDREHGESDPDKTPTFVHTFEKYFLGAQTYILQPTFFASIGFAIPFRKLWTGQAIWHGIVFTLLMLFGKLIVGFIVPIRDAITSNPTLNPKQLAKSTWKPASLLAVAMVARGEIGLLIVQIGLNETPFLSEEAFVTATWATVLSTIIGPVVVGLLLKRHKYAISDDLQWGMQDTAHNPGWFSDEAILEEGRASRWASRRHSRAISRAASERSRSRAQSRAPSMDQRANASGDRTPLSPRLAGGGGPDPEEIRRGLRNAGGSDGNLQPGDVDEKGVSGSDKSDAGDANPTVVIADNNEPTRRRVINFDDTPAAERKMSVDVRGEVKDDTPSEKPDGP